MTQNLYLGSSLDPALVPDQTPAQFVGAVAQIYGTAVFTNFPKRAEAIADTVATEEPDLIGLQEVTNWIAQPLKSRARTRRATTTSPSSRRRWRSAAWTTRVAAVSENADIGPAPLVAPDFGCGRPDPPRRTAW